MRRQSVVGKTAVKKQLNQIKQRTPLNSFVNAKDASFMLEIFKGHPNFTGKTKGLEVTGFIHDPRGPKYSGFKFVLSNGYDEIFGVDHCFKDEKTYQKDKTEAAYRNAIHSQILDAKARRGYGIIPCDLCKRDIENRNWNGGGPKLEGDYEPAHVDHNRENRGRFTDILSDFQESVPGAKEPELCPEKCLYGKGDQWTLAAGSIRDQWLAYHEKRAKFRFLCGKCNGKEK